MDHILLGHFILFQHFTIAFFDFFNLFINAFVIYFDVQIINSCIFGQVKIDLRGIRNVEIKVEIFLAGKVLGFLFCIGYRVAKQIKLIVSDIFCDFFRDHFIDFLDLHSQPILFLDYAHGHLTRPESRHCCLLTEIFQFLVIRFNIVLLLHFELQRSSQFTCLFFCNNHSV